MLNCDLLGRTVRIVDGRLFGMGFFLGFLPLWLFFPKWKSRQPNLEVIQEEEA